MKDLLHKTTFRLFLLLFLFLLHLPPMIFLFAS